MMHHIRFLLCS